jgi:hypothetical protein
MTLDALGGVTQAAQLGHGASSAALPATPANPGFASFESFLDAARRLDASRESEAARRSQESTAATDLDRVGDTHLDTSAWRGDEIRIQAAEPAQETPGLTASRLLDGADQGFQRMNELMAKLDGNMPISSRELLAMQVEISKISLALETTTKAVTQVSQDVKQLFQQQI